MRLFSAKQYTTPQSKAPPDLDQLKLVIVHHLAEGEMAVAAASTLGLKQLALISAPAAAEAVGIGYFDALIAALRRDAQGLEIISILDCGSAAGRAVAAVRSGFSGIVFTGTYDTAMKLVQLGETSGVAILTKRPPAFDISDEPNPSESLRQYLAS